MCHSTNPECVKRPVHNVVDVNHAAIGRASTKVDASHNIAMGQLSTILGAIVCPL